LNACYRDGDEKRGDGVGTVLELHGSQYAGPPHLFSLPHRAHAVVKNGYRGPHTYFSVI